MSKAKPNHLKLHVEELPQPGVPQRAAFRTLPALSAALGRATGWTLSYLAEPAPQRDPGLLWSAPVEPGVGTSPGHLRLDRVAADPADDTPAVAPEIAIELATSLAALYEQLLDAERHVWHREAELAAGVPVLPHHEEEQHLAARLESLLAGVVQALQVDAAGLYLLDEDTKQLKLRSVVGLPRERLTAPPRPLADALADLEALLGHAVVLEDTEWYPHWNVPEAFAAAVCVPVSTPTIPLGTLWLFSSQTRDFSERETNIIEIVAGRVAAELEREMLLSAGVEDARLKRQLAAAERMQQHQLPRIAPLLDDWDLAAWNRQASSLGGDFYDWFPVTSQRLAVVVGDAQDQGVSAALCASGLRSAVRAHAEYLSEPDELLARANRSLWISSPGDQTADLACALVDVPSGTVRCGTAGDLVLMHLSPGHWQPLAEPSLPLGNDPDAGYAARELQLAPGEVLLLASRSAREVPDRAGRTLGDAGLAETLLPHLNASAETLVELVRDELESRSPSSPPDDLTIVVLKRTGK